MPTQPLPCPPAGDIILADLLALISERTQSGLRNYGQLLRTDNGRDTLTDLVEELYDALLYALALRHMAQVALEEEKEKLVK